MTESFITLSRAVILDADTLGLPDLDLSGLRAQAQSWTDYAQTQPAQLSERIADAEVVISNKVVLSAAHMDRAPRLRLICVAATGTNNIDIEAANARGIAVCNARNYSTEAVAQHALTLMLMLTGQTHRYLTDVRAGAWSGQPLFCLLGHPTATLSGKTLGLIGYGNIGARVGQLASALGMRVIVGQWPHRAPGASVHEQAAPTERVPMDELFARSDVLSLHCPLVPETEGLMSAARFAQMRRGAIFINVARGGLVDEAALLAALSSGHLGGAGLDVLQQEPPSSGHPLITCQLPNLLITPHIAWAARSARQLLLDQIAENMAAFARNQPLRLVGTARQI